MERIWMKNWPAFIPQKITYPKGEKPVFEYLRDNAREFSDRTAVIFYGKEISYGQLDRMSEQFAHYLLQAGLQKGDRIALFLPSCPQYHIAHYGISKMGGIIVPCSPLFKEWELSYQLGDTGAKAIVCLDLLYPVVSTSVKMCPLQSVIVTSLHDFLPSELTMNRAPMMQADKMTFPGTTEFLDIFSQHSTDPVDLKVELDDPVQLQFTGGTTGLPKGAVLTHRGKLFKVAALLNVKQGNRKYLGIEKEHSTTLAVLPTFHIAGMLGAVDSMIAQGDTQVLMLMFDPIAAMQAIERYKIDFFQATVPMNIGIMDHPERKKYDLSSLKSCLTTSFSIQLTDEIAKRWSDVTKGCLLAEAAYGLTETHTFDTFMPFNNLKNIPGCQGIPIPGQQIKIVSWEDRTRELPIGQMGEIVIKNPAVFKSYWNKPAETKDALVDGWVYTGDMGRFDQEGYLYFLGRKKEMIKVSGFSVFPEEIETFLLQHDAVEAAAVIGVPDSQKGEMIKAFIVVKPQFKGKLAQEDIIAWAKPKISSYKVPKTVEFRDELPVSGVGKVLRRVLVEEEQGQNKGDGGS